MAVAGEQSDAEAYAEVEDGVRTSPALWFHFWLAPRIESTRPYFCERWFEHPEFVHRVELLWHGWASIGEEPDETTRGAALCRWFVDVVDPTLTAMTSYGGPFARCGDGHRAPEVLSTAADD